MKTKLISRIKKLKKEKALSYQELSVVLGYVSATTSHRFLTTKLIPKNKYDYLDKNLKKAGY